MLVISKSSCSAYTPRVPNFHVGWVGGKNKKSAALLLNKHRMAVEVEIRRSGMELPQPSMF